MEIDCVWAWCWSCQSQTLNFLSKQEIKRNWPAQVTAQKLRQNANLGRRIPNNSFKRFKLELTLQFYWIISSSLIRMAHLKQLFFICLFFTHIKKAIVNWLPFFFFSRSVSNPFVNIQYIWSISTVQIR